jgi:hypothetical protein
VTSTPLLAVDGPGASVPPVFDVGGWAVDLGAADGEVGMDAIHVYAVDGGGATFLGATTVSRPRPDVAAVLGSQFADSGYRLTSPPLPLGAYTLVVYAHSTVADAWISQARAITVRAPRDPVLNVDTPLDGATVGAHVVVAGWAADLDALQTKGVGVDAVHIWAIDANGTGTFLGATAPGSARPDVANAFGPQFRDSGFAVTVTAPPPGAYTLVVYAHSAVSGQWSGQTRAITVRPPGLPAMNVDTPAEGATATQPFILAGWAVDLDAASGPGVDVLHVWAIDPTTGNGTFVGATTTGGQRDDVGAAFGSQFATAGFNLSVFGLAPGTYQLIVYAHSTVTDTFSQARVVAVTIQ